MDVPDFDQDTVYVGPDPNGPEPSGHQRALLIPPEAAIALREARLARSLSPAEEAASCHVPVTLVLGLEAGRTTEFVDEDDLLTTVERIATFLGFPPGLAASDILRAWSSAYARRLGDIELPVPLAPTQPLPLVSQPGRYPARSATDSPDISQGSRPGSRRSRPRSPPRPAEPLPGLAKRRAPSAPGHDRGAVRHRSCRCGGDGRRARSRAAGKDPEAPCLVHLVSHSHRAP